MKFKNKLSKTVLIYLCVAVFSFIFAFVYFQFSHGVFSYSMFLVAPVLLVFGAGIFFLFRFIAVQMPQYRFFRLFYNLYNSALAIIGVGMAVNGILTIAGTGSNLVVWYFYAGGAFAAAAVALCVIMLIRRDIKPKHIVSTEP